MAKMYIRCNHLVYVFHLSYHVGVEEHVVVEVVHAVLINIGDYMTNPGLQQAHSLLLESLESISGNYL